MITLSSHLRLKASLLLLIAFILNVDLVRAQTSDVHIPSSQMRIAQDLELIRTAEQTHLSETQRAVLWKNLALNYHSASDFVKAEDAYNRALRLLKTAPSARAEYASTLDDLASLYLTFDRLEDAESAIKQALKVRQNLGSATDLASSEVHLADIALVRHQFKKAEGLAQRGLDEMESSPDPPKTAMLSAFITLTYARCSRGHCREGLVNAEQAVDFARKNSEPESVADGFALETLGFAKWKSGERQDGEKAMFQAIQMLRTKLAPADPRLAGAMLQYRAYLLEANRQAEAQEIHEEVTRMTRQAGVYCQGCAISVNSLSNTLR
jgi:tetratricopeptide (TPR) repeat protein